MRLLPFIFSFFLASWVKGSSHLQVATFYTYVPDPVGAEEVANVWHSPNITLLLQLYQEKGIVGLVDIGGITCDEPGGVWDRSTHGLCETWEANIAALQSEMAPHLPATPGDRFSTALLGVFLGDEVTCWGSIGVPAFEEAAAGLRKAFGAGPVLYENECVPEMETNWTSIPLALDWISIDLYNPTDPAASANESIAFYNTQVFPKMASTQRALLVPGTFANPKLDRPLYDARVKDMLEIFWNWAVEEQRVIGFNPWHYYNLSFIKTLPIQFHLGLEQLPNSLQYYKDTIAAGIINK